MSLIAKITAPNGVQFEVRGGCGNPYEGKDDIHVTRNGDVVKTFNSLGDNYAYTNAKKLMWERAAQEEK